MNLEQIRELSLVAELVQAVQGIEEHVEHLHIKLEDLDNAIRARND